MAHKFSVLYILFGTLQAVTGIFDTSNYQVVTDSRNQGFSYYAEQCNSELTFNNSALKWANINIICLVLFGLNIILYFDEINSYYL